MTMYSPESREFIWLPDTELDRIATEYYGRTYVGQQTGDMLPNDSYHHYEMDKDSVEMWLSDLSGDPKRLFLGLEPVAQGTGEHGGDFVSRYAEGVDWFEYWAALTFDPEKESIRLLPDGSNLAEANESQQTPREWEDARGFVFKHECQVYRMAPTPQYVLADLISNGVLPYGDYLVKVSW